MKAGLFEVGAGIPWVFGVHSFGFLDGKDKEFCDCMEVC